jgi:hypothetical protein
LGSIYISGTGEDAKTNARKAVNGSDHEHERVNDHGVDVLALVAGFLFSNV